MKPLLFPLTHLSIAWDDKLSELLKKESEDCFSGDNKSVTQLSLISVGGIECQDLPMSGNLKETMHLKASPYLRYFLACITQPLGRVCLYKSESPEITASPLYQNRAYPLFYQTVYFTISETISLIIEVRTNKLQTSSLFDTEQLLAYRQHNVADLVQKQSLAIADPQLDVLQPIEIYRSLNAAVSTCKTYQATQEIEQACAVFVERWASIYNTFEYSYEGEWSYQSALNEFRQTIVPLMRKLSLEMTETDRQELMDNLQLIDTQLHIVPAPPKRINRKLLLKAKRRKQIPSDYIDESKVFDRPIFIVSAPRAGSTLLFETLSQFPEIWSTGEENHALLENIKGLHPSDHQFASNRLDEHAASSEVSKILKKAFISKLHNRKQHYYLELETEQQQAVRFLEKTPKNALRIPFLKALFPDALFVYLARDYKSNVSSLIDGWRSHQFIAYQNVPEFKTRHWKFLLTQGWQDLHDRSIADIAHQQWQQSNQTIQQDLSKLSSDCWMQIDYHTLIAQPETVARQFAEFAGLAWDDVIQARCENGLPVSRLTLSSPQSNKWQKHQCFLEHFQTATEADVVLK